MTIPRKSEVKKSKKVPMGTKGSLIMIIVAVIIVGVYYVVATKDIGGVKTKVVETDVAGELLLRNLDTNYPPSPREVIKYYSDITQEFYSEKIDEEQIEALAIRSRMLFDKELLAQQTDAEYLESLKTEIASYTEKNMYISSYSLSSSVDVKYSEENGFSFARVYCIYSLREAATKIVAVHETFLLRKDEDSHWKIYGFTVTDDGTTDGATDGTN